MSKASFSFFEVIIAVGALVTSAAAVVITLDQAKVMHEDQAASVLPALQIDEFSSQDNMNLYFGFNVENAGVGPAFLHGATLKTKTDSIKGLEHLKGEMPPAFGLSVSTEPMSGRVIAPGVSKEAIRLNWRIDPLEGTSDVTSKINVATGDLTLEICYCSTLGKCWVAKSGSSAHPEQLSGKCPVVKEGLF